MANQIFGGEFPPRMVKATRNDLIEKMKEMVPYYTPEWRFTPEDPDPGTALFLLFADMFIDNVDRFNRIPLKHRVEFLNLLNLSMLDAKPARSYVTFFLSSGAGVGQYLPAGTQVAALAEDGGEDIPFATDSPLWVTPAQLVNLVVTQSAGDRIIDQSAFVRAESGGAALALFDQVHGENVQEHSLVLGHADLLLLHSPARVEIELQDSTARYRESEYAAKLANPAYVEWQYSTDDGWQAFDTVQATGNRILLEKSQSGTITPQTVMEQETRLIRCLVLDGQLAELFPKDDQWRTDGIRFKTSLLADEGVEPDLLFSSDVQVGVAGCYPFGEFFIPQATFYLSSEEVLSKKNAWISLTFDLEHRAHRLVPQPELTIPDKMIIKRSELLFPKESETSIQRVIWEYWNGKAWVRLDVDEQAEELFDRPEAGTRTVRFRCPSDLEATAVNSHLNHWIRMRVLNIENLYTSNPLYLSPWIANLRLSYDYEESIPPERVCSHNNRVWRDHTALLQMGRRSVTPFVHGETDGSAVYFGFDLPPFKGPISMYVDLQRQKGSGALPPVVEWEYLCAGGAGQQWAALQVFDETGGLSESGVVQFAGPPDLAACELFGHERYWVRAVYRDGGWQQGATPMLRGIHLNTAPVTQGEYLQGEHPDQAGQPDDNRYTLAKTPIFSEVVWVDETGSLSEGQVAELLAEQPEDVEVLRDSSNNISKLWVRWRPIDELDDADAADRVYEIDRSTGLLLFGDGKCGKALPNSGSDKIRVHYWRINGGRGNVGKGTINVLSQSIAFVSGVSNPVPAGGGCDQEDLQRTLMRGPQKIKHRNKAVTAADYEWLAQEAYPDIARVKCLPEVNADLLPDSESVTLVVVPKGGERGMHVFPQVKRLVEAYLRERAPVTVAMAGKISVIEPLFVRISIMAHLVVGRIEQVVTTEREAYDKLNVFLDPFTGNYDGKGFRIGQSLQVSAFYAQLKSIPAVQYIKKLSMTISTWENEQQREISVEEFAALPHGLIVNGTHQVVVEA